VDSLRPAFILVAPMTLWLLRLALVGLVMLTGVNGAVRVLGGGEPGWVSPLFLEEKVSALGRLLHHHVQDLWSPCADAPEVLLRRAARRHGVPVELAVAVGRVESGLHPHRISAAGAMGLMQLMPGTARDLRVTDPFDAEESVDGGVRYLKWLLARYGGDRARAIAAYNAGPGVVPRAGALVLPRETRVYVERVQTAASAYVSAR
jgi:hypothetical protein